MSTEQAPESCPFCGAGLCIKPNGKPSKGELGDWSRFTCGTYWFIGDAESERRESQEPRCVKAERERLTRERDEWSSKADKLMVYSTRLEADHWMLLARVKRLEEAGDFMAYNENEDFEALVSAWEKAKEGKP